MKRKSLVGATICAGVVLGLTGGTALADHGAPHGKSEAGNGVSICMFSGLNDDPEEEGHEGQVQSYGQIVRYVGVAVLKAEGETPGDLCNPNNLPFGNSPPWHVTPRGGR